MLPPFRLRLNAEAFAHPYTIRLTLTVNSRNKISKTYQCPSFKVARLYHFHLKTPH